LNQVYSNCHEAIGTYRCRVSTQVGDMSLPILKGENILSRHAKGWDTRYGILGSIYASIINTI